MEISGVNMLTLVANKSNKNYKFLYIDVRNAIGFYKNNVELIGL